ncbi:unnamed protein product [Cyprideis torosa]|uniref:Uncharacterized protein n=1 Tax=Cyprideis torosa TaxID=163714 RepID=A0A7R8WGH0_9CRUS|nr:unnamed protein product [Cyprideis torosa]CAG0896629.1 unnamed protein product [Cyprideis torosa]
MPTPIQANRQTGRILKTVDSVYQKVESLDKCRAKCLEQAGICNSYDYGDTGDEVCRLSHHTPVTLTHVQEPFLLMDDVATYEIAACYTIGVECLASEMVAYIRSSKLFSGKVYAKQSPLGCTADIKGSMNFSLSMAYSNPDCGVAQDENGLFSNEIVVQHHDRIVTSADLGLSLLCQYDLSAQTVVNNVSLEVQGKIDAISSEEVYISSPSVRMRITDRKGEDISFAQVGDPLMLVFDIKEEETPFDIFVKDLYAMDGSDSNEIVLIDEYGCPTDPLIMGPVERWEKATLVSLRSVFEAFKFPTSDVVSFRAVVVPCVGKCEKVTCSTVDFSGREASLESRGRRRRRRSADEEEELMLVQSITISDKFGRRPRESPRLSNPVFEDNFSEVPIATGSSGICLNFIGLVGSLSLFVIAQVFLIVACIVIWNRKRRAEQCQKASCSYPPTMDSLSTLFQSGYAARRL